MPTQIPGKTQRPETCKVTFTNWNRTVECAPHTNLRDLALEHDLPIYNGLATYTNCQGHGLCGTCAVEVTPQRNLTEKRAVEKLRFVQLRGNLRLACQTELAALQANPERLPFAEGLPARLTIELESYREDLLRLHCPATDELDLTRTEREGIGFEHK